MTNSLSNPILTSYVYFTLATTGGMTAVHLCESECNLQFKKAIRGCTDFYPSSLHIIYDEATCF